VPTLSTLIPLLQLAAAGALGVFAGTMLAEGFLLVPYWRSLPPSEFFAWYAANDRRLLSFFSPVTTAAAVLTLLAALASGWGGDPGRWSAIAASALMLGCVAVFFVHFESANASFSAASVPEAELPVALASWAAWHHARTAASLAALALMLAAIARRA